MMGKKKRIAVIFGAGGIGRGFIGHLLHQSGYDLIYVDVDDALIQLMRQNGGYELHLVTNGSNECIHIPIKRMLHGQDREPIIQAIQSADIMFTAVGNAVLPHIAPNVAQGLAMRQTGQNPALNIILCENLIDADRVFAKHLIQCEPDLDMHQVGLIRASVGRMVPNRTQGDDLGIVIAEPYDHLLVDGAGVVGVLPPCVGVEPEKPFDYVMARKLYIHNLGHTYCAWLGRRWGYALIADAIQDPTIQSLVRQAMVCAAHALHARYHRPIQSLIAHIDDLIERFGNRILGDTIDRVGRDTLRKLSAHDRVVGAVQLCIQQQVDYDPLLDVLVAGLKHVSDDPGSIHVQQILQQDGLLVCLERVCDIKEHVLVQEIKRRYAVMDDPIPV